MFFHSQIPVLCKHIVFIVFLKILITITKILYKICRYRFVILEDTLRNHTEFFLHFYVRRQTGDSSQRTMVQSNSSKQCNKCEIISDLCGSILCQLSQLNVQKASCILGYIKNRMASRLREEILPW